VLVIDDHALFAQGLALLIERDLDRAVEIAASCEAGLKRLAEGGPCALIVLDLELPGLSGLEGLRRIRSQAPQVPVVVVSSVQASLARDAVVERGAHAFVSKAEPPERLMPVLRSALGIGAAGRRAGALAAAAGNTSALVLTGRQQEVLLLVAAGKSNKVIARQLGMSENTVRNHVAAILDRLGAASRMEAAQAARRLGLLADPS